MLKSELEISPRAKESTRQRSSEHQGKCDQIFQLNEEIMEFDSLGWDREAILIRITFSEASFPIGDVMPF